MANVQPITLFHSPQTRSSATLALLGVAPLVKTDFPSG